MPEITKNEDITVGTSPLIISEGQINTRNRRKTIAIQNNSTGGQTIRVAIGKQASTTSGLNYSPGGGFSDSEESGYRPTQERITAVASAAGAVVTVMEVLVVE